MFSVANKDQTLNALLGAACGGEYAILVHQHSRTSDSYSAAGQRCMAISVGESWSILDKDTGLSFPAAVFVGAAQKFLPELITRASKLQVNQGFEKGAEL